MATQPIRPALDIPDVKEQLGHLVAEIKKTNGQLHAGKRSFVYLRKISRSIEDVPLKFFLLGTPLAIILLAFVYWFKPDPSILPPETSNYFFRTSLGFSSDSGFSTEPKSLKISAFSGPVFASGSEKDCLAAGQTCADPKDWESHDITLSQFLANNPKLIAWFLQTGYDRDQLGVEATIKFGSNHGLALARFNVVNLALQKLPELKSATQLPPILLPGYAHEPANKQRDRTPTLYLIWGKQDGN